MSNKGKVVRYELLINGEHEGYYMTIRKVNKAIDDFYMCKPKWYETEDEYERACEYRDNANVEVKTEILSE